MAWTNRGLYNINNALFRGSSLPTNFYLAFVTTGTIPDATINIFSQLEEIAPGNGYSEGGIQLVRNSTDFPTLTENDVSGYGASIIKDISVVASGGSIPPSGAGASYIVLLDDNATIGSREVWAWWELSDAPVTIPSGNTDIYTGLELRISQPTEPAQS